MRKWIIISLTAIVILVGAGVLVYNFLVKPNRPRDATFVAVKWNSKGFDRFGRPLSDGLKKNISDHYYNKLGHFDFSKSIEYNYSIIGDDNDIIRRIDPYRLIWIMSRENGMNTSKNTSNQTFNDLIGKLFDIEKSNIRIIGKPTERLEIEKNDYLLLYDSFSIENMHKNRQLLKQIDEDRQESANMNPFKGYHELKKDDDITCRMKLFKAYNTGEAIIDYNFILGDGTTRKSSIKVVVK